MPKVIAERAKVAVLGATGIVGQRFIVLLEEHPWFELSMLGASKASAGHKYKDTVSWRLPTAIPSNAADLTVHDCSDAKVFRECKYVFSALDASIAVELEPMLVAWGLMVFSNASAHRQSPSVPLVVPTANPGHLKPIGVGHLASRLIANANCTTTGVAVVLSSLQASFGPLASVTLCSMQAVSGAGLAGGPSFLDLHDNVIPFIDGEEEKIERELRKILGGVRKHHYLPLSEDSLPISASCNRVPVSDGHLVSLFFSFSPSSNVSVDAIKDCLRRWDPLAAVDPNHLLPHRPIHPIHVLEEPNRPQTKLDRDREDGFAVSVGRIRKCSSGLFGATVLIHNTVLGAAGASLLNAEIVHCNLFPPLLEELSEL